MPMHNRDAVHIVNLAQRGVVSQVRFISPIVSALVAAESLMNPTIRNLRFSSDANAYAANNGLLATIAGQYEPPVRGGLQGKTYSQLTRLQTPEDVDFCNGIVADLLYNQLGTDHFAAAQLAKIVGELHDNVISHAGGAGFSSAQVYQQRDGKKRIEYGIADVGCGILYNASRAGAAVTGEAEAIKWALQKGTTSGQVDGWAQRLPWDAGSSPYPDRTDTTYTDNHHLGLGLFELGQLVRGCGGHVWIWSGTGMVWTDGQTPTARTATHRNGVAVEFEVVVPQDGNHPARTRRHGDLRERLNL
jgi:hypothetical protein